MPTIISISGPPGSGKSSLASNLARLLQDTATVHFDHYEQLTDQPLEDVIRWMDQGADIDRFVIPGLSQALATLKRGAPIVDPLSGKTIQPAATILFETPFGRRHTDTGRHIDLSLWIDTPLDVALARKLKELTTPPHQNNQSQPEWLTDYLDNYITGTHALLRMQRDKVRPTADVVIDGLATPNQMAEQAHQQILDRL